MIIPDISFAVTHASPILLRIHILKSNSSFCIIYYNQDGLVITPTNKENSTNPDKTQCRFLLFFSWRLTNHQSGGAKGHLSGFWCWPWWFDFKKRKKLIAVYIYIIRLYYCIRCCRFFVLFTFSVSCFCVFFVIRTSFCLLHGFLFAWFKLVIKDRQHSSGPPLKGVLEAHKHTYLNQTWLLYMPQYPCWSC